MRRLKLTAIVLSGLILWLTDASPVFSEERLKVFVSILPQKYFVEKIGGDAVEVSVMVAPGASPATYEPRPRQMMALSETRVYFAIGVPFEAFWLGKIAAANSAMQVVHTQAGVEKIPMASHGHDKAGPEVVPAKDAHGVLDPHIWLAPPLVKLQVQNILNALVAVDPSNGTVYRRNGRLFFDEIDDLDTDLKKLFLNQQGLQFLVFHPSWGYFARAYGLHQVPIEVEGKDAKPGQLQAIITRAREMGIRVVFAQPQFSAQSAQVIARAIGGEVVLADPLAENWTDNIRVQAEAFKSALR